MMDYENQVKKMAIIFSGLNEKQRGLLIEGFGEVQGMINAGMIENAMKQLQSMKDIIAYPRTGIPAAVFSVRR